MICKYCAKTDLGQYNNPNISYVDTSNLASIARTGWTVVYSPTKWVYCDRFDCVHKRDRDFLKAKKQKGPWQEWLWSTTHNHWYYPCKQIVRTELGNSAPVEITNLD